MTPDYCDYKTLLKREECIKIAQKSLEENFEELIEYKINLLKDDAVGFLGEYYNLRLLVKDKNGNKLSKIYFIKSIPLRMKHHRKLLEDSGLFKKEVALYNDLLETLQTYSTIKWLPKCYYNRSDILVLEDLVDGGYQLIMKPNELDFIKANLKSLASLHACSFAYELETGNKIGEKFSTSLWETSVHNNIQWYRTGIKALRDASLLHPKFQGSEYQNFIRNEFIDKVNVVCDMVNESKKFHNVLCHRDSWGSNIFFKEIPNNSKFNGDCQRNAVIVDYQTCRYCPPAVDVLFCVYMNTDRRFREKHYEEFLDCYYEYLQKELKLILKNDSNQCGREIILSKVEFLESCEELKLLGAVYNGIFTTLIRLPDNKFKMLKDEDPEKFHYYANVNRSALILPILEENKNYREILFEAVEEIVDMIHV